MENSGEKPLRGGLIGCGFFARNHLHSWRLVEGAEIVALCDRDLAKAEAYASEFGVTGTWNNPEQMLRNEDLDFVDIVTTPETHRELVLLAARSGVNAICQKPMAPTLEDAAVMVDACREAGTGLMIHENFRWQPALRELKRLSGQLGELYFGRFQFLSGYDVYANQPYLAEDPRFILYDVGVHILDLVRFFFGEASEIVCHTRTVNPRIKGEDVAIALIRMETGASCTMELSYAAHPAQEPFPQTLVHLEGSQGSARLGQDFEITQVLGAATRFRLPPPRYSWSMAPIEAVQASIPPLQQHWVDVLRGRAELETSGEDNLRTLRLMLAAYESADSGGKVVRLSH